MSSKNNFFTKLDKASFHPQPTELCCFYNSFATDSWSSGHFVTSGDLT